VEGKAVPHMLPVVLRSFAILTELPDEMVQSEACGTRRGEEVTDRDEPIPLLPIPRYNDRIA
jgi:hypothetical protein